MIVMVSQYEEDDELQVIAYGNPDEMRADFLTMHIWDGERVRVFEAISFGDEFAEVHGRKYDHCTGGKAWGPKKRKKKRKH